MINNNIREEKDARVAQKMALKLEREERLKERELQEKMRLQLRLDDEAAQVEAELGIERRLQEERDQVIFIFFLKVMYKTCIE